jgi:predicted CXXCH cytochrome family protein
MMIRRFSTRQHCVAIVVVLAALTGVVAICVHRPGPKEKPADGPPRPITQTVADRGFVGSTACKDCHPGQYASWHRTYHRTMTQPATAETVLAPTGDIELSSRGRTFRLSHHGDEFSVTTVDSESVTGPGSGGSEAAVAPQSRQVTRPVVMTTGSHHMQGYWIPRGHGNEVVQVPFFYHLGERRWIPREDVFLRPPGTDPLPNWGANCIKCHAVGGVPTAKRPDDSLVTQVAELGIACEACHGPGANHVATENRRATATGSHHAGERQTGILNPRTAPTKAQSEICGQCHSQFVEVHPLRFWTEGLGYRPGGALADSHRVISLYDKTYMEYGSQFVHTFWNDGTCRVGGDEFNALIKSPCYERGELSCLSCHSMHHSDPDDMLREKMEGNHACQQCHAESRFNNELERHTHHGAASSGSQCYNCHMPYTSYALMTALRSHRVTSPRAGPVVTREMPNACNLCHLDKTLKWSSFHLGNWYSAPAVELSQDEEEIAASLIWLLRGDAVQRALAAWHMGWAPAQGVSGNRWQAPLLARLLEDPYAAVRYQAICALKTLPGFDAFTADFIGSSRELQGAGAEALSRWRQQAQSGAPFDKQAVPIVGEGEIVETVVKQLLRRRDDSPVGISE